MSKTDWKTAISRVHHPGDYDSMSRYYDLIAGPSEESFRQRGLRLLAPQPGEYILEIGCGTGPSLPALTARVGDAGCVVGIDLSGGMLAQAHRKNTPAALEAITRTTKPHTKIKDSSIPDPSPQVIHLNPHHHHYHRRTYIIAWAVVALTLAALITLSLYLYEVL